MTALKLTNSEDVSFSASAASTGGHRTLTTIPGAKLWGRAAGGFYGDKDVDTYVAVHSGALRFSPGFPLTATGAPAFPMPQSFREPKRARGGIMKGEQPEYGTLTTEVWNLAIKPTKKPEDAGEALKGWYLAADHSVVRPRTASRGKTAVIEGERTAETSAYFQYEHLRAGQDWAAWIEGDDGLAVKATCMLKGGVLRLGRSSQKEFGGGLTARTSAIDDPRAAQWREKAENGRLVLWCLTDLALIDAYGAPDLSPEPASLIKGGFAGQLNIGFSSISTRRYAPFNDYLGRIDREHAVIEAGSVLVYDLKAALDLAKFRAGLGLWRERGLGMVWPNPLMLLNFHPAKRQGAVVTKAGGSDKKPPVGELHEEDLRLLNRLRALHSKRDADRDLDNEVEDLFRRFDRALRGAKSQGETLPTATQWSALAQEAETMTNPAVLRDAIFDSEGGMCAGRRNPEWRALEGFLKAMLGEAGRTTRAVARVCRRLRASNWGSDQ